MSSLRLILAYSTRIMRDAIQKSYSTGAAVTYSDTVETLNGLQSNAVYLKNAPKHDAANNTTLQETKKYVLRSGITWEELNSLSVIHVAGTKGKGSTCAFVEAIMREHGYRTGLYTSPHLVSVRERIRINGQSISEAQFTTYFWQIYQTLKAQRHHDHDMPHYFQFLTIMMFHVFLKASIDVAIIEVGIGGEHDCTNIIESPVCVGITKLDFDHMSLLGDTLPLIAEQKSGIFKKHVPAFTVPQEPEALEVVQKRAVEKNCILTIVPPISSYSFARNPPILGITADVQFYNASLAIQLASVGLMRCQENNNSNKSLNIEILERALATCKWPGRTQILRGRCIDFYLDGAHTIESMKGCVAWFNSKTNKSPTKRVLLFNVMGNRDYQALMNILKPMNFDAAFFTPSISGKDNRADQDNRTVTMVEQMNRCERNCQFWGDNGTYAASVSQALALIEARYNLKDTEAQNHRINLLITGSLHLIGAALSILDEDLTMSTKF